MTEQQKPQAPTIEQVTEELRRTRVALNKAMQQREVVANEAIDLTVSVDEGRRIAQAQAEQLARLRGELAEATAKNTELTTQLASRAQQRAGKKK